MKARRKRVRKAFATLCALSVILLNGSLQAVLATDERSSAASTRAMALQTRIFGKAPNNQSLDMRLASLETYLLGKAQSGDASIRLDKLQQLLDGKPKKVTRTEAPEDDGPPLNPNLFDVTKVDAATTPTTDNNSKSQMSSSEDTVINTAIFSPAAVPSELPVSNADLSLTERVRNLEKRVFGHLSGMGVEAALSDMERFAIGEAQSGSLQKRLDHLENVLNGREKSARNAASDATSDTAPALTTPASPPPANKVPTAVALAPAGPSSKRVLRGRVDTLGTSYALAGITLNSNTLPASVTVKEGSRALKAGLASGDKLLHGELGIDTLMLVIDRKGHKFRLEVPLTDHPQALVSSLTDVHLTGGAAKKTFSVPLIKGEATADWKVLKQYDIAVLLDVSGSMTEADSDVNMTKNEWCRQEISNFAVEAERIAQGSFDFYTFNHKFSVIQNCSAVQAVQQLDANPPRGGTDISTPLEAAIESRATKSYSKPFLIVVITDGMSYADEPIDSIIVRASQHARSANDIKIIFLQIGKGPGRDLVDFLDSQLLSEGAPRDIVSSIEWEQLSPIGLRSGLVAALRKPLDTGAVTDPKQALQFAKVRERLDAAKAQYVRHQLDPNSQPFLPGGGLMQNY